jgi:hypothetical protein
MRRISMSSLGSKATIATVFHPYVTWRRVLRQVGASPFFYALLPSLFFYSVIFSRSWIPIHDTFQISNIVYFILNQAATHHTVALWYPYINFGVYANWYLAFTIGPSLATILAVVRLLSRGDLLDYYYLSMFMDELILLVGTYLLARTLFKSRKTAVFVCIAMSGSSLWFAQAWFNFHLYYFIPLSAYFVITGAERNEVWRLLAGGFMLLVSEFGNLPYFVVPHALFYLVFVAGALWGYAFDARSALRRVGVRELIVAVACALAAGLYLLLLSYGVNHVNYDVGRTHNVVTAENFLTYGGAIGLSKFAELLTGASWDIDINVYAGVLVTASVLLGLLWVPERRMAPFLCTLLFFGLLSVGKGSFVAPLVYLLPGIAYYRHIGLVLPIIKVMLIVLSGFGFDALIGSSAPRDAHDHGERRTPLMITVGVLVIMLVLGVVLAAAAALYTRRYGHQFIFNELTRNTGFDGHVRAFLGRVAFVIAMYLAAISVLVAAMLRKRTSLASLGIALLLVEGIDVYSYRMFHFEDHMVSIGTAYRELFVFRNRRYASERLRDPMRVAAFRIVTSAFHEPIPPNWYESCVRMTRAHCYWNFGDSREGVYYDTIEPFVGFDPCRSIFRVGYWLPGVDVLYRAITNLPLHDVNVLPKGYDTVSLYFPIDSVPLQKAIACGLPKFQLFSSVEIMPEREMAALFRDPQYRGDLLLASTADYAAYQAKAGAPGKKSPAENKDPAPDASSRLDGDIRVLSSDANSVVVRTTLPQRPGKYWLYFADAWHPFWHASVNGNDIPVLRANFGFKAVPIGGGETTVRFTYRSTILLTGFLAAEGLLIATMLAVLGQACRLLFERS